MAPRWPTVRDVLVCAYLRSGLTYERLSERSGLHPHTVAKAMHPRTKNINVRTLLQLSEALGVCVNVGTSAQLPTITHDRVSSSRRQSAKVAMHDRAQPSLW